MASMVEALGIGLPTNAAIPAADSRRYVLAHMAGQRIVEMVREDLTMSPVDVQSSPSLTALVRSDAGRSRHPAPRSPGTIARHPGTDR
jgi:hypothetical protein